MNVMKNRKYAVFVDNLAQIAVVMDGEKRVAIFPWGKGDEDRTRDEALLDASRFVFFSQND